MPRNCDATPLDLTSRAHQTRRRVSCTSPGSYRDKCGAWRGRTAARTAFRGRPGTIGSGMWLRSLPSRIIALTKSVVKIDATTMTGSGPSTRAPGRRRPSGSHTRESRGAQVGHGHLVVVAQLTVEEGVMGLVRAGELRSQRKRDSGRRAARNESRRRRKSQPRRAPRTSATILTLAPAYRHRDQHFGVLPKVCRP